MQTYTGKSFDLRNFTPDDIDMRDISHSLSLQCRFTGHCKRFYSIAQHSFHASFFCKEYPLVALLHDAAEAYIGDIGKPLKVTLHSDDLEQLEDNLLRAIFKKYIPDYTPTGKLLPPEVKEVDLRMLATEKRDLMNDSEEWFMLKGYEPYPDFTIRNFEPKQMELVFRLQYDDLINKGHKC